VTPKPILPGLSLIKNKIKKKKTAAPDYTKFEGKKKKKKKKLNKN
jgi:hypothetical protein